MSKLLIKSMRCLFLLAFTLSSLYIHAQIRVHLSGRIVNSVNNHPVDYAEVRLLAKDSSLLHSVYTSTEGLFEMDASPGDYLLQVGYLGHPFHTRPLALIRDTSLGSIGVELSKAEDGVTVVARKKLIERKIDRLSFNVENSVMADGADGIQVLKNTPLVSVTDFSIGIFGKSSVLVMIDDRIVNMSGTDLINYLKSLRSSDIARIEVITTPPSKYVAEGNSGLINIVLKKNMQMGWSGSTSSSYTQTTYAGFSNNGTVNYRTNRVHLTARLRQYDLPIKAIENIDIIGSRSLFSSDTRKDMYRGAGANLNFLYKLSDRSELGFIYDLGLQHIDINERNRSEYATSGHTDSVLLTSTRQRNPIDLQSINAFYNRKLDTLGRKLSFSINYLSNGQTTQVNFETVSSNGTPYRVLTASKTNYAVLFEQLDLYLPFHKWIVETGALVSHFSNNSDVRYFNYLGSGPVQDNERSNIFDYKENNYALYASASRDFGKQWSVKGGLRYEFSTIDGESLTTAKRTKYSYPNLFPTLYIKRELGTGNTLTLSYAKRISRPKFGALNPFRWYTNPFTFSTGNPLLQPSYNHNVELGFNHKSLFSISAYFQRMENGYGRIVSLHDGIKEVNYFNYLSQSDLGSNAGVYLHPAKWWEMNTDLTASYSTSSSTLPQVLTQSGFSFYYSINNTFTLNKAKGLFFYLNFWNNLPATRNNLFSESLSSLTGGLRFNLFKDKIRVNTFIDDAFRGLVSKGRLYFDQFIQRYNNYYDARRFTLSLSYNFGNKNVGSNSRQVRFTEKNRLN